MVKGLCNMNIFTVVIKAAAFQALVFVTASHFHLSLVKFCKWFNSGKFQQLKIRLE